MQQFAESADVPARRERDGRIAREQHGFPGHDERIAVRRAESRDDPPQLDVHHRPDRQHEPIERRAAHHYRRGEQGERVSEDREMRGERRGLTARLRVAPDRPRRSSEIDREGDGDAARDSIGSIRGIVDGDDWGGDAHASAVLHSRAPSVSRPEPSAVPIDVVTVTSRTDLRRFVDLPWRLFDTTRFPQWVPPLRATVYDALDRAKNPFYAEADRELFLALRDGAIVGRIAAIENRAHNRFHGDRVGFWGFFESVDDQDVADALFGAAAGWLSARGLEVLRGPMNPSTNYECGLLIDGYEHRPSFMTTWNPPYYAELCDRAGLGKIKDLVGYHIPMGDQSWTLPETFERLADRALRKSQVAFRDLDL